MTWQRKKPFLLEKSVWYASVTKHGVEGKAGEERGTKLERKEERKSKTSPIKIGRMN